MATFSNQASLRIGGAVTNSNVVTGEITNGIELVKLAVSADYGAGESVTYLVSLRNDTAIPYNDVTVTDDLGAFTLIGGTDLIVPLDYIDGSLVYLVNGVISEGLTVLAGPPLTISGINIPAGGTVTLIYEGRVNDLAPLAEGSQIINTVNAGLCESQIATATVAVRSESQLSIAKSVSSTVVTDCELAYTFVIQNTGNAAVVATDNLIVSDVFNPILKNIEVTLDGVTLEEGVGYTYDELTGVFSTTEGAIAVPAATYTRDPATGAVTTTPGSVVLTVSGTV